MKKTNVKFATTDQMIQFVNIVEYDEADIDLKNGSRVVDAKSLLGVLSFGINKLLELVVFDSICDSLLEKIYFVLSRNCSEVIKVY